nr:hypothetical protein [Rivihabitans pingtungensis]
MDPSRSFKKYQTVGMLCGRNKGCQSRTDHEMGLVAFGAAPADAQATWQDQKSGGSATHKTRRSGQSVRQGGASTPGGFGEPCLIGRHREVWHAKRVGRRQQIQQMLMLPAQRRDIAVDPVHQDAAMHPGNGILGMHGRQGWRKTLLENGQVTGAPIVEKPPDALGKHGVGHTNFQAEIGQQAAIRIRQKKRLHRLIESCQLCMAGWLGRQNQAEHMCAEMRVHLVHGGKHQRFFAAEVVIQAAFGDATGFDDFVNTGGRIALGAKKFGCPIQQGLPANMFGHTHRKR